MIFLTLTLWFLGLIIAAFACWVLYTKWFVPPPTYQQAREYTIQSIRDFLDHTGGPWDWDDFTSCPMKYPDLEAVRQFCIGLRGHYPPEDTLTYCNELGLIELRKKLEQLERKDFP